MTPTGLLQPLCKTALTPIEMDALKDMLTVGGLGLAGGVGARGLLGLSYMFGRKKPAQKPAPGPTVITVPTPVLKTAEEFPPVEMKTNPAGNDTLSRPLSFVSPVTGVRSPEPHGFAYQNLGMSIPVALDTNGKLQAGPVVGDWKDPAWRVPAGEVKDGPDDGFGIDFGVSGSFNPLMVGAGLGAAGLGGYGAYKLYKHLFPDEPERKKLASEKQALGIDATTRWNLPWYFPGMFGAAALGLGAGYHGMDALMDHKRKQDLDDEIATARADYEKALLGQYDPANLQPHDKVPDMPPTRFTALPGQPKPALKVAEVREDLEKLADAVERRGAEKKAEYKLPGWVGTGLGLYGMGALGLGGLSALMMYKLTKDRSTSALMQKALKDREREQWLRRPPEIYAVPQPVRVTRGGGLSQSGKIPVLPGEEAA